MVREAHRLIFFVAEQTAFELARDRHFPFHHLNSDHSVVFPSAARATIWRAAARARRDHSSAPILSSHSVLGTSRLRGKSSGNAWTNPTRSTPPSPGGSRAHRAVWINSSLVVGMSAGASHNWP